MRTVAVLPVKRFSAAKQRLDAALSTGARRMLAEAMVSDVLTALRRTRRLDAIAVVTGESSVEALARGHGAETIPDPDDAGHVPAALLGVRWATEGGAERVLLVPGDCPAASPDELDEVQPGGRARDLAGRLAKDARHVQVVLDVDTAEDLAKLRSVLARRTGEAAHTRGLLAQMGRLGAAAT